MKRLKGLLEVLSSLKRKPSGAIKLCPRCGSPDIHLSSSLDVWLTPEQYVCEKCGYKGPIVLEVDIEGEEGEDESGPPERSVR